MNQILKITKQHHHSHKEHIQTLFSQKKIKPNITITYNKLSNNSERVKAKEISCAGKATTKFAHYWNIFDNEDRA